MCQIKATMTDYLFQSIFYLISALCCTQAHRCFTGMGQAIRLSFQLWVSWYGRIVAHRDTHSWRLSLALPPFPSQISFDKFGCYEHRFLDISSYLLALFGNFKAFWLTVRLRGKAVRPWVGISNCESNHEGWKFCIHCILVTTFKLSAVLVAWISDTSSAH